ncbi:hypothetical protein [Mycoplasma marinum]|uniref:KAP NTPase domain-containing protein n=1 Tax=Mycoplasma marinum TaxID=1937190 RepID=A0A4R0XNB7_9MOLU|nr:hypothetical protein [Mycoplasma marinum]TCG10972.1 hypothetical protein C4B24_03355 [Mycoplasma marinum]
MYKEQIEQLIKEVSKKDNNRIIVSGDFGVGKTTMVRKFAEKIKGGFCFNEEGVEGCKNKKAPVKYIDANQDMFHEETIAKIEGIGSIKKEAKHFSENKIWDWLSVLYIKNKKIISFAGIIAILLAIVTIIPLAFEISKWYYMGLIILMPPLMLMLMFLVLHISKIKHKIIIVDNLDRIKFNSFEKILSYKFSKNKIIIFIFDSQNIAERYVEEYGRDLKDPFKIFEKYSTTTINIEYVARQQLHNFFEEEMPNMKDKMQEIIYTLQNAEFSNFRTLKKINGIFLDALPIVEKLEMDMHDYYFILLIRILDPIMAKKIFHEPNFCRNNINQPSFMLGMGEFKESFDKVTLETLGIKNDNSQISRVITSFMESRLVSYNTLWFSSENKELYFFDYELKTIYKTANEIHELSFVRAVDVFRKQQYKGLFGERSLKRIVELMPTTAFEEFYSSNILNSVIQKLSPADFVEKINLKDSGIMRRYEFLEELAGGVIDKYMSGEKKRDIINPRHICFKNNVVIYIESSEVKIFKDFFDAEFQKIRRELTKTKMIQIFKQDSHSIVTNFSFIYFLKVWFQDEIRDLFNNKMINKTWFETTVYYSRKKENFISEEMIMLILSVEGVNLQNVYNNFAGEMMYVDGQEITFNEWIKQKYPSFIKK